MTSWLTHRDQVYETDAGTWRLVGRSPIYATRAEAEARADYIDDEERFLAALHEFASAGNRLVEAWTGEEGGFNADEAAPLPEDLRPPASLDEWLADFVGHYERTLDR
jgi:hypothetical protein